jgi:biopolymer transport protein ExbB
MKKSLLVAVVAVAMVMGWAATRCWAQGAAAAPAAGAPPAPASAAAGTIEAADGSDEAAKPSGGTTFFQVVFGSGPLGVLLWIALFGAGGAGVYFVVDCAITVREKRIMPQALIDNVTEAMSEGDVLKALQHCENEPGPLANVLTAGFSHVEEGFDVIQEAITTAADMETEKIMQKLTWLSVCANIAPMLGLLGTVQGMIAAFENIGRMQLDIQLLAINIGQALYTTAAGLLTAVPCVTIFYTFRNAATKIILRMEAMTMELIKDLRNVEVVQE